MVLIALALIDSAEMESNAIRLKSIPEIYLDKCIQSRTVIEQT